MTININKDSWHYKWIMEYSDVNLNAECNANLCAYTKGFIQALWNCMWGIIICSLLGWCILDTLMYGAFCIIYRTIIIKPDMFVIVTISAVVLSLFGAILLYSKDWLYANESSDNLFVQAVRSKFHKYCVKVNFQ